MKANKAFNHWLKSLGRAMVKRGVRRLYPKRLAQAHWQDYYDDAFTPMNALDEDLSQIED